jgi:hypothetical protein
MVGFGSTREVIRCPKLDSQQAFNTLKYILFINFGTDRYPCAYPGSLRAWITCGLADARTKNSG